MQAQFERMLDLYGTSVTVVKELFFLCSFIFLNL